jgi:tetratricopeptide (TPR) repeat protein
MRQVVLRALGLLRRPLTWIALLPLALGGAALVRLPLFGAPGFELSLALSVGLGLLGGLVGIAAGQQEARLIQGKDPRPKNAVRFDRPSLSVWTAFASALLLLVGAVLIPFLVSVAYAVLTTRCDPFANVAFFPWLTLPSAALAAAAGVLCGLASQRSWKGLLSYSGLVLASAVWTAWPVYFGPQVFAFNHFGGYFPGPLYDEALVLRPSLAWFRLETLLWALLALSAGALLLRMREGRLGRPHVRPLPIALIALAVFGISVIEGDAVHLGLRMNEAYVAEELGGVRESPHFVVHYPADKGPDQVERLVRDLEFRYAQDAAFLGGAPKGKVRVFVYRSAEQKQALVGAANTQFAKPWQRSLHVNDAPFPHPVVKHELAHVLASAFAPGPFHITERWGLPRMAVVEGVAVAADDPGSDLTLHQLAEAMRKEKLAPDLVRLFSPSGFYAQAPARAYTVAGSFIRYLADHEGKAKLQRLYAHGDFQAAYGRPLPALVAEWEGFLDGVPLTEGDLHRAFDRFRVGSLFTRSCAREVAGLAVKAQQLLWADPARALELYRRCAELQPEEPSFRIGEAQALRRMERLPEADQVLRTLAGKVQDTPSLAAQVALVRADLLWREKPQAAREVLERSLKLSPGPALTRTAQVRLAAIDHPESAPSVSAYFAPLQEDLKLWRLQEAVNAHPDDAVGRYLLGRRLVADEVGPEALANLSSARAHPLPPEVEREALRLELLAGYLAGDCGHVRTLAQTAPRTEPAFAQTVEEWVARCDFEQTQYGGALVPRGAFR